VKNVSTDILFVGGKTTRRKKTYNLGRFHQKFGDKFKTLIQPLLFDSPIRTKHRCNRKHKKYDHETASYSRCWVLEGFLGQQDALLQFCLWLNEDLDDTQTQLSTTEW